MKIAFTDAAPFISFEDLPHWIRVWQEEDGTFTIGGYRGQDKIPDPKLIFVANLPSYHRAAEVWGNGFEVPSHLVGLAQKLVAAGDARVVG